MVLLGEASSGLPESHPLAPAQESNCLVAKVLGCQRGRAGRRAVDQWPWLCLTWVATWAQVCSGPALPALPALAQPSGLRATARARTGSGNSRRGWTLRAELGARDGARGGLDPGEGCSLAERLVNWERQGRGGLKGTSAVSLEPESREGKGERTCGVYESTGIYRASDLYQPTGVPCTGTGRAEIGRGTLEGPRCGKEALPDFGVL